MCSEISVLGCRGWVGVAFMEDRASVWEDKDILQTGCVTAVQSDGRLRARGGDTHL